MLKDYKRFKFKETIQINKSTILDKNESSIIKVFLMLQKLVENFFSF